MTTFSLITDRRSGTHMLYRALITHPQISITGSPFNPEFCDSDCQPESIIRNRIIELPQNRATGMVIHRRIYFPHSDEYYQRMRDSISKVFCKHVCLVRENLLKQYISEKTCQISNKWDCMKPRQRTLGPIAVDTSDMIDHISMMLGNRARMDATLKGTIKVTYQSLCDQWDETTATILDYIGVDQIAIRQATFRQETRPISACIKNVREVRVALESMGLRRWLTD